MWLPTIEKLERLEPGAGLFQERSSRKVRVYPRNIRSKAIDKRWGKEGLERLGQAGSPLLSRCSPCRSRNFIGLRASLGERPNT